MWKATSSISIVETEGDWHIDRNTVNRVTKFCLYRGTEVVGSYVTAAKAKAAKLEMEKNNG